MLPIYTWWQIPYFFAQVFLDFHSSEESELTIIMLFRSGCKMYDILAGKQNMESSYVLGAGKALEAFPMLKKDGLCGAVVYYDGTLKSPLLFVENPYTSRDLLHPSR